MNKIGFSGNTRVTIRDFRGHVRRTTISEIEHFEGNLEILGRFGWETILKIKKRPLLDSELVFELKTTDSGGGIKRVAGDQELPILRYGRESKIKVLNIGVEDSILKPDRSLIWNKTQYIDLLKIMIDSDDEWQVIRLDFLKKYIEYQYSETPLKMETQQIGIKKFKEILNKYQIPQEVLLSLSLIHSGWSGWIPLYLEKTEELNELLRDIERRYSEGISEEEGYLFRYLNPNLNKIFSGLVVNSDFIVSSSLFRLLFKKLKDIHLLGIIKSDYPQYEEIIEINKYLEPEIQFMFEIETNQNSFIIDEYIGG